MRFLGDNQAKVIMKIMFLIDGFQRVCAVLGTFIQQNFHLLVTTGRLSRQKLVYHNWNSLLL